VRVDEVDEHAFVDASQLRRRLALANLIPPHVRDAVLGVVAVAEAHAAAAQDAEAAHRPALLALLEQRLQAEADAEKRRAALDDARHDVEETVGAQVVHAGAERADARQYNPGRAGDDVDVARDLSCDADLLE